MPLDPVEFCPPLLYLNLIRIDNPGQHKAAYAVDLDFFRKNPKRRTYLRVSQLGEFDGWAKDYKEHFRMPTLWVVVARIADGVHIVIPVFRGKDFWQPHSSDSELAYILSEMARRNGFDVAAYICCEQLSTERKAINTAASEIVN